MKIKKRWDVFFIVNGKRRSLTIEPHWTLLEVLRDHLGLTGAKKGCDRAECGSCTVLLEREPVYACQVLAVQARGQRITTIEGLERNGKLHPIQQSFVDHDGVQCGFCTPGFIMTANAFLERTRRPSPDQVKQALSGNICGCSAYAKIIESVLAASRRGKRTRA